ncbi:MAG: very short patch repair endonuclease [Patescibacteria group bacterium]|nr:MAG: very short patch repair endonuclease [Patescibacteria group bacterium]
MSKIRSQNTKVERLVFRELKKRKVYFQKHYKKAIGNPDIALPSKRKAIFIDGDFWHGYRFSKLKQRLSRKYWLAKIERNIERDKLYRKELKSKGWKILRVWEHELLKKPDKAIDKIVAFLSGKRKN